MIIAKLIFGSTFVFNKEIFLLTQDFNRKNQRYCINIKNGSSKWIDETAEVDLIQLYIIDKDNNFMPLKEEGSNELLTSN